MKYEGLTVTDIATFLLEYQSNQMELTRPIIEAQARKNPFERISENTAAEIVAAENEALIRTIVQMINRNSEHLLTFLKHSGVLPNED